MKKLLSIVIAVLTISTVHAYEFKTIGKDKVVIVEVQDCEGVNPDLKLSEFAALFQNEMIAHYILQNQKIEDYEVPFLYFIEDAKKANLSPALMYALFADKPAVLVSHEIGNNKKRVTIVTAGETASDKYVSEIVLTK